MGYKDKQQKTEFDICIIFCYKSIGNIMNLQMLLII